MSEYSAGSAVAKYILDRSDVRAGAAEIRATFARIRQDAASLGRTSAAPLLAAPDSAGIQAYVTGLREAGAAATAAQSPIQALVADLRAQGAALGQTDEQINAHLAVLSREALAVGDVTRALALEEAALGAEATQQADGTAKSLQRSQAEARAALAARDYAGAMRIVSTELANQGERTVGVINAERQLITINNQATAAAERAVIVEQREADTAIRIAQQRARAAIATKDYAGALEILNVAQTENAGASATALASLETQIATTEAAGTATGALGAELGGLLSPLALVTVGVGVAVGAVKSFGDALSSQGKIDESRRAFDGVFGSVKVGNAVLDEAIARARAFGFTTKETGDAFRELSPIIRESTASVEDQVGALARFSVLHPDNAVNALKTAVEGLQSGGRISGIAKDLGLTADEQERLKKAVKDGKDVFVALNEVLDRHGVTLDTATQRMQGYEGAARRAALAQEELQKAQADFGQGPGTAFIQEETTLLTGLTRLLNGDLKTGFQATIANQLAATAAQYAYGAALNAGKTPAEAVAAAQAAYNASLAQSAGVTSPASAAQAAYASALQHGATQAQAQAAATLAATQATAAQAQGAELSIPHILREADADDRLAGGALNAARAVAALNAAQIAQGAAPLPHLTDRAAGAVGGLGDRLTKGFEGVAASSAKADQEAVKLLDSEVALAAAKKQTAHEIELLRQKQSQFAKGTAEYNTIEAQIIGIQTSAGKVRVSAAQSTALQLQNVEENSGLALLKTQRENLERLRDQEEDFTLRRVRSKEDEDRKIQGLLARGQIAAAKREREDFARSQQRDQEDFNIQRQRTLRNNAESTGDIGARTDLRETQIGNRAALRGVKTNGGATLGNVPLPDTLGGGGTAGGGARVIQVTIPMILTTPDGQKLADITYPFIAARIDDDLSIELRGANPPGANQTAVSGARP